MPFILPALLLAILLAPVTGQCALEKYTPKIGNAYMRPKLAPPPGWHEHDVAGQRIRGVAFLWDTKNPSVAKAIIYARAIPRSKSLKTLSAFIQDDIATFKQRSVEGQVQKGPGIIGRTRVLPTYTFSSRNRAKVLYQTVAYLSEGDYYLTFVLTAPDKQAHDQALATFKSLVTLYR
jgi:hypothetical protein